MFCPECGGRWIAWGTTLVGDESYEVSSRCRLCGHEWTTQADAEAFDAWFMRAGVMSAKYPPTGKRGTNRGPVLDQYVEEKMARALAAKRIVDIEKSAGGLRVVYVTGDAETGQETVVRERLTGGSDDELDRFRDRLIAAYDLSLGG